MTFINWSDPEEMLGLLADYVADENGDMRNDGARTEFLAAFSADLAELMNDGSELSSDDVTERLRSLLESQAGEFAGDPVLEHFEACLDELARIRLESRIATAPFRSSR